MVIMEQIITKEKQVKKTNILQNKWKLWAHLPNNNDWSINGYNNIYIFTTIEDTIAVTEYLPDILIKNCMLFIMKENILPMWEDSQNINGGSFSYKVLNKFVVNVWRNLTYVLVGNTISNNMSFVNCVTGITISPKKNFCIIKIWISNSDTIYQNPYLITCNIDHIIPKGCIFKKHNN